MHISKVHECLFLILIWKLHSSLHGSSKGIKGILKGTCVHILNNMYIFMREHVPKFPVANFLTINFMQDPFCLFHKPLHDVFIS
jgi:hypothetical protein